MADSSKITTWEEVGRSLSYEELDGNFSETKRVIDDFNAFTQSQKKRDDEQDENLENVNNSQTEALNEHINAEDPHPQYEFRVRKNLTAQRAPSSTDDEGDGYSVRSIWYDRSQNEGEVYVCIDATEGSAVWVKTTLTIDELGSAATAETDYLLDRENHTGTQPASTISDFEEAVTQVDDDNVVHAPNSGKSNEAGDAYKYDVGTESGQLMKVGAFGLGSEARRLTSTDDLFNLPLTTMFFFVAGSAPQNYPAGASTYSEGIFITRNNSANQTLLVFDSSNNTYISSSSSGTFGTWKKMTTMVEVLATLANYGIVDRTDYTDNLDDIVGNKFFGFNDSASPKPVNSNYDATGLQAHTKGQRNQVVFAPGEQPWTRCDDGSGFGRWYKMLIDTDIVGTVSTDSNGISTGAIMQIGTNSNGTYIKYANGVMQCIVLKTNSSIDIDTAVGPIYRSGRTAINGTYPAEFATPEIAMSGQIVSDGSVDSSGFDNWIGMDDNMFSTTGYRTCVMSATSKTNAVIHYRVVFTGYWKVPS